jgi:hypothetical protein
MTEFRDFFSSQHHKYSEEESPDLANEVLPPIRIELTSFVELGCAAWKLRQKVFDQVTGEPREEVRQLARHVTVIWDRLSELGLQIQDHTGNAFDSGQSLQVLAFQPTRGILRETVVETVRPTVYFGGKRILKGQVIVGTPDNTSAGEEQL